MPILLTTSFNAGDLEPQPLTHVMIKDFNVDIAAQCILIRTIRGYMSGSDFIQAANKSPGGTVQKFLVNEDDYVALVAKTTSATGVPIYDEVARELYQYLIDKGHFAGTIV